MISTVNQSYRNGDKQGHEEVGTHNELCDHLTVIGMLYQRGNKKTVDLLKGIRLAYGGLGIAT